MGSGEGTIGEPEIASEVVHYDLKTILGFVQVALTNDIANAIVIAENAGFETKDKSKREPRQAECFQCNQPG